MTGMTVTVPVRKRSSASFETGWTSSAVGAGMSVAVTARKYKLAAQRKGDP
jgi:hypothetical protein